MLSYVITAFLMGELFGLISDYREWSSAFGQMPIAQNMVRIPEISVLIISLISSFFIRRISIVLTMLYVFLALEYVLVFKLIICKSSMYDVILSSSFGLIVLLMIVLNQYKNREQSVGLISKQFGMAALLAIPIISFMIYGTIY